MKSAALVLVTFLFVLISQAASIPFHSPTLAHADPALSGATTAQVPNGDFSGVGLGDVGTPPTNGGFETARTSVGTPASNYDFASGDFTGWTLTGSPTIQSGGPSGYYAQLGSGQKITGSAFTVDSGAQTLTFNVGAATSTYDYDLIIKSGSTYATTTTKTFSCYSSCSSAWTVRSLNAVPFQGQSIKIEVKRWAGTVNVDDAGVQNVELQNWTPAAGDKVTRSTGGPNGAYVETSTAITSEAFAVDSSAQNASVEARVVSGSGAYSVTVLSGSGYGTATQVYSGSNAQSSWGTRTFGIGSFSGQSIKLRITPDSGTSVAIDRAGIGTNVIPGWSATGTDAVQAGAEGGQGFAAHVSTLYTGTFHLDSTGYYGGNRGNWFRVVYRLYENYDSGGTDLGSYLDLWDGQHSTWSYWGDAGKASGAPYSPTRVWLEEYFFVVGDPNNPFTVSPKDLSFRLHGWGPTSSNCNPSCGGRPDLAVLEMVDGPGQTKVLGNGDPLVKSAIPSGFAYRIDSTDDKGDPVELTSGTYFQAKTDLAIPGRGVPLTFTRSYSAAAATNTLGAAGPMGAKWSHNWQASLKEVSTDQAVRISLPAGASSVWYKVSGVWKPPTGVEGTLVKNAGGDWTLTTAGQLVYAFDSSGKWTSVKDRNNNTTTLTYDGSGRLSTVTDPGSRNLTLTYGTSGNGDGRIVSVSDGTRSVSYGYSTAGDLTTITDVMGGTISYQYAGHLLTQGTDAKGNVFVRNTYDTKGRVSQQLDAAGGTTTFAYDTPGAGATRVTDQRGKQTTYYFDQQMRITDVKDHDGGVTTTVYDANNNKTSVTNPLGQTWSYTYDARHNVLTATDPLTKVWTYTYNARNDVLTVTDPLTRVTTYAYDGSGNLTSVTDANSKTTSFTVNANGLVTAVTDPLTHATSFGYDSYGNRTTVTNALTKTWTYAYDSFGRVTSVTDPLTHATSYTYNNANLVLTVTDPLSHVTTYTYDANGNVLTVTDANTKVTTYAYNNKDQLTSVTDAASGVMSFGYDAVGNLTTKTNPRSKTTTYTYDNLGRLASESDPLSHVRSYSYDAGSRLTSRTDAKSQTVSYTYNNRNELTNITYPDLSYTSFAYNDAGARTQMVDGTGATAYSYDSLYRLTSVTFPGSRTVSYSYDDASRRTAITYPGGTNQASYAYDAANRLSSVTDWNSNTTSYSYDDANRMTTTTLPSGTGVVSTYSYDNANRLTSIVHDRGGTIASASYTLDNVGNRTQRVDQQGTHSYAYDNLYRLTSVTYPGPSTTTYAFDAFGNRTSKTDGSGTTGYSYDDADRITAVTPPGPAPAIAYSWDNNGNLTNRGSDSFSWDYEDRMTSATVNSVTTSFAYRGDGLRDSRTTGGNTTTFTWDITGGLPVVLDDGSQYVYGAGLTAMKQSGSWFYYLADGLGSTMAIVDSSGTIQKGYTYDVYGKATATGGLANEFDFAGQQTDPTGLQYLRARYMDPETGTFLSRDPLALSSTWLGNPTSYSGASPVSFSDSGGERPCNADDDCQPGSARGSTSSGGRVAPTAVAAPTPNTPCGTPTPQTACPAPPTPTPTPDDLLPTWDELPWYQKLACKIPGVSCLEVLLGTIDGVQAFGGTGAWKEVSKAWRRQGKTEYEIKKASDTLHKLKGQVDRTSGKWDPRITVDGEVYNYNPQLKEWESLGNVFH